MTEPSNPPASQSSEADDDEFSFLDLLIVLAKHKTLTIVFPFVIAMIAAGYSLSLPNIYTANTRILPPQQGQSTASAMLAQLGGVASLIGAGGGLKSSNDVYVAMLRSRTVADNLIRRFDLRRLWDVSEKHPSDAYDKLAGVSAIIAGKDGIITIEVDDEDPKRAADLANAYVDELFNRTSVIAVTEASQRRLFFERQYALAKENLSKAEISARRALQAGGLVKVDEQGRAMLEATARLRAQITVKQVQIGAMRTFAADGNPDLQLAVQELESLKRELFKIEGAGDGNSETRNRGGHGMDNLSLLRDVKYFETISDLLAKQYEMAKIDEAKDSSVIQVLDKAIVPDRRSNPKRTYIVLVWAMLAGFVGLIWAVVLEAIAKARSNPKQADRLHALGRYLARR